MTVVAKQIPSALGLSLLYGASKTMGGDRQGESIRGFQVSLQWCQADSRASHIQDMGRGWNFTAQGSVQFSYKGPESNFALGALLPSAIVV